MRYENFELTIIEIMKLLYSLTSQLNQSIPI